MLLLHNQNFEIGKMKPRIRVPANFGKEHINSPVHGNIKLKLKDGQEIKVNSIIMSLNSPVIDNLTSNLTQVKFPDFLRVRLTASVFIFTDF